MGKTPILPARRRKQKEKKMTAPTFTQAALALVTTEARNASDLGFKLVGACSTAFIGAHFEKSDAKVLKADMVEAVEEFHKSTHANDLVNAGLRLARRFIKDKQLLATVAAETSIDAVAIIIAAEARTIAHAFGSCSLRSLFEALKPAGKERKASTELARAMTAIAKLSEYEALTLTDLDGLADAVGKLRASLAAALAQEQVDAMAVVAAANAAKQARADKAAARKAAKVAKAA
jgi:hypothetical protein